MSIKIQINSLEALERLIGGDSDLEIEVRKSVLQTYSRNTIKEMVTSNFTKNLTIAISKELNSEYFDKDKNWPYGITFKPEILQKHKDKLRYEAQRVLTDIVSEVVEEMKIKETIKKQIAESSKWIIEELSKSNLEKRLDKMVEFKLKEKLGLK